MPEEFKRGYRYVMCYLGVDGIHIVGSHDGLHWDLSSNVRLHRMHSDHANNIVYDPLRKEFVMYCRSKHIYRVGRGPVLDVGASHRVSRMSSPELWSEWKNDPQTILIPDELDNANKFNFFYGFTVHLHAGIFWGFLQPFKWNTDICSELAFSRDGITFNRLPTRPRMIDLGPPSSWDSGLVFAAYRWVEVGDEWWIYYSGWDGPHGSKENMARGRWRVGGIGLAKLRNEGFISMRGPENGGVIITRKIAWPGGELIINADARGGELKVRVNDGMRKLYPGFDYRDCETFTGNSVAHRIRWKGRSLASLKDQVVRLEFYLKKADMYTFRAAGDGELPR